MVLKHIFLQATEHQIIFMEFSEDEDLLPHSHGSQWGIVLESKIDLIIDGVLKTFRKGDIYYIPFNVIHFGKIYKGYADSTFFIQVDRSLVSH